MKRKGTEGGLGTRMDALCQRVADGTTARNPPLNSPPGCQRPLPAALFIHPGFKAPNGKSYWRPHFQIPRPAPATAPDSSQAKLFSEGSRGTDQLVTRSLSFRRARPTAQADSPPRC